MQTPVETIASRLSREMESWKAIEIQVQHRLTDTVRTTSKGEAYSGNIEEHYIETATGQRLIQSTVGNPDGEPRRDASFSDGSRFVDITYKPGEGSDQQQYKINTSFGNEANSMLSRRPQPLSYLYLEHKPLHEQLPKSKPLGSETHLGREGELFLFSGVTWFRQPVDLVYLLDRETGLPLKVTCYASAEARENSDPLWTWEADTFDQVGDHHFPLQSTELAFVPGQADPRMTRTLTVKECAFDKSYPKTLFQPAIQPGASVWDVVNNKNWVQRGAAPTPAVAPTSVTLAPDPSTSIAATPPADRTTALSYTVIGLGMAALLVAIILWRRR